MGIAADLRVLASMARGGHAGDTHRDQLEAFYGGQADAYDDFRERLLHGRGEMLARLPIPAGARVAEIGGGTGRNLEFLGNRLHQCASVHVVDLCPSLLRIAEARARGLGWDRVHCVEADATTWEGPGHHLDAVWFAYSLTMIPDWRRALERAVDLLKPGGWLGVVDFYVAPATPPPDQRRHPAWVRWFWRRWFAHDGVHLDPAHLAWLRAGLETRDLSERFGTVPWLLGARAPYYRFIGRKAR